MKRLTLFFFVVIIFLSFFLRLYKLQDIPNGFHRDEAFLGYNAYSILRTGHDISDNFFPIHLESFLFTPAGYSYVTIPIIFLFGLNEFSIRLPSALFSIGGGMILFFLVTTLMSFEKKTISNRKEIEIIALLSVFLFLFSPWNLDLSRTASVITVVVFFILTGILMYLRWIQMKKPLYLFISFFAFFLSLGFYIAPYLFLVLFLPVFFFLLSSHIRKSERIFVIILFFLVICLPFILTTTSSDLSLRMRSLSITNSQKTQLSIDQFIREDGLSKINRYVSRSFHNKIIGYSQQVLDNYFEHLSYSFLFTDSGYPDRYRVPFSGLMYLFELPLLITGGYLLFQRKKKIAVILFSWILLSPVGSSFASDDVPNLQRTFFMLPALSILGGYGLYAWYQFSRKTSLLKYSFVFVSSLIIASSIIYYCHQYFIHSRFYRPWYRQDGYKILVQEVNNFLPHYKKAVITNRESAPTIFFLFYSKFDPALFQNETKQAGSSDFDRIKFWNYIFSEEECPAREVLEGGRMKRTFEKNILYVNSGLCKEPESLTLLKTIKREDNSEVFHIVVSKQ